jgi:lysophospholipase L1-like esterase
MTIRLRLFSVLILALLPATPRAEQPPAPANLAISAEPRNDWMRSHENFNAIAKKGGIDLLFLGDSITDGWKGGGKNIWGARYASLKPANFGIGGDRTENVLWRIRNGNLDGISPKALVLLIGTNNVWRDTPAQVAEGVATIVQEIRTRLPETKVLLLAIFPRGEKPDDSNRPKIAEINASLAKLDDGQRVFFLDIGRTFLQPDGTISKDIMPDYLHLTPAGYQLWSDSMQEKLTELMK